MVFTWIFALFASVILLVIVAAAKKWTRGHDLERIPCPGGKFLIGSAEDLSKPNVHRILTGWANQYGGVYRLKVLWRDLVVVSDPQLVSLILRRDALDLPKEPSIFLRTIKVSWRVVSAA